MKPIRFKWAMCVLITAIGFGVLACNPATQNVNSGAPTANTNASPAVVDTAGITSELTRIENDYPRVLKEKDVQAVDRLEADDIVVIYPDGSVGTKAQDVSDIQNGALSADSWEVTDVTVKVLDNDAAFASGRSIVKGGKVKGPDGRSMDISGEYRFIDTFARRNGAWKLVGSITTKVQATGEPGSGTVSPMPPASKPSPSVKASPTTTVGTAKPTP